jgi:hypothetical protein
MNELKLRKSDLNVDHFTCDDVMFEHVMGEKAATKSDIKRFQGVFLNHGYYVLFPHTLHPGSDVIYRVKDGVEFFKNEDGTYSMKPFVEGSLVTKYDFEILNDPYYFTTNKPK